MHKKTKDKSGWAKLKKIEQRLQINNAEVCVYVPVYFIVYHI